MSNIDKIKVNNIEYEIESSWANVTGKPSAFPPADHNHDSRYYTEAEVDSLLSEKADTDDVPTKTSDLTNDSGFLTEHQSLAAYRTASAQDDIDATKASASSVSAIESKIPSQATSSNQLADKAFVNSSIADMATKTWVGQQGFLTQHQDISGKENISNKVASISSASTDTQYPTAKCVYDAIEQAIGDAIGGEY